MSSDRERFDDAAQQLEERSESRVWDTGKTAPTNDWQDSGPTHQAPEDPKDSGDWEKGKGSE